MIVSGHDLRLAREQQRVGLGELARLIHKSVGHLSRVERQVDGRHPSPAIVYLYEQALGGRVAATADPGQTAICASTVDGVNRRDLLTSATTATVAGFVLPAPHQRKVRAEDIEQIDVAITAFGAWDHAFGGGHALEVGRPHLDWACGLLQHDCPQSLRTRLFSAVGGLVSLAGFMAFDAFQHRQARDYFALASTCADEADDVNLHARVLSSMARQAVWCGKPKDALSYLDKALSKAKWHTATELAEVQTIRARALARMGASRQGAALAAVSWADRLFAQSAPADDPKWIKFYDAAQHHGDTAHALFDLEIQGVPTEARARLEYAVAHHEPGFTRSRTFSQIKLATLIMANGDPQEAAAIGGASVVAASRIRSHRARTELMALRTYATQSGEASDLTERIDDSIADSPW